MKRRDTEIWDGQPEAHESAAPEAKPKRRKDTDLGEPSVRKSRRQLRREEEAAEREERSLSENPDAPNRNRKGNPPVDDRAIQESHAADGRAPWDDPAGSEGATQQVQEDNPEAGNKKRASDTIASVLSGNILSKSEVTRAYPYMIFIACLMFLYIANVFRTQYIYREHARLTEQVKELRAKSMTIASDKMQFTRQSNIMVELERRGIPLRESLAPNKVIPNPKHDGQEADDR